MAELQAPPPPTSSEPAAPQSGVDDLCDTLAASATSLSGASSRHHPPVTSRLAMYKNRGRHVADQAERRRRELELQKERRFNALALVRRLAEDDWTAEAPGEAGAAAAEDDEDLASVADESEDALVELDDTSETIQRKRRPGKHYRNQLMLSEWLLEVPDGFETDFVMKLCPQGKRTLVVAAKGATRSFDRRGRCTARFPADVPGGNRQSKRGLSVLDCIWDGCSFHVLDLMHWRDLQLYDTESTLRFHWLETNVAESAPNLHCRSQLNRHPFVIVQSHSCDRDNLAAVFSCAPPFRPDGVLFYHRSSAYTFGSTPLVAWLKPYMLNEMFGIACHPTYSEAVPAEYAGCHAEIARYEETRKQMAAAYAIEKKTRHDFQSDSSGDQSMASSTAAAAMAS